MYRSSVISQPRHWRLFSATLVAGAVSLAFVPTARALEIETGEAKLNECYFDGQPHERKFNKTSYGDVEIIFQKLKHAPEGYGPRPIQVVAVLIPGITVGHRGETPQPSSGFPTGDDVDPGHVIALHLGGPDNPLNIVPQWAHWQRYEEWRAMERRLDQEAKTIADASRHPAGGPATRSVLMNVAIVYTKFTGNAAPRKRVWAFPKEFVVTACPVKIAKPTECDGPYIYHNQKFEGWPGHL